MSPHDTSFITSFSQKVSLSSHTAGAGRPSETSSRTEPSQCLREGLEHLLEEQKGIARLLEGDRNLQRDGELRAQYEANIPNGNSADLSPNQESQNTFRLAYRKTFRTVM